MNNVIKLLKEQYYDVKKYYLQTNVDQNVAYNNQTMEKLNHLSSLAWFRRTLRTEKNELMIYSKQKLTDLIKHSSTVLVSPITQKTLQWIRNNPSNYLTVIIEPHSIIDTKQRPVYASEFRAINLHDILALIDETVQDLGVKY